MMQIPLWTILFIVETQCEILSKAVNKSKDNVELWKPDLNSNKLKKSPTKKSINLTKTDKPVFRHNILKEHEITSKATSKWPKILRKHPKKDTARVTKMHMMRKEETTVINLDDDSEINEYFSSYSIKEQLQKISRHIPESNITMEVIGRTEEYQDIVLLKMTDKSHKDTANFRADDEKYADDSLQKKIIFIVHGLSVMGLTSLDCLTYGPSFLTLVKYYAAHLDVFDIFLIPMANPDGFAYTKSNSMWNKNLSPQSDCSGVSLDRNFDVAWNNNRSISSCSPEYPGPAAFSEAETRAIRDVFHKYGHKIIAYLNVHAGTYNADTFKGDAVLYPKGYTEFITDEDKYIDLKGVIDEAIRNARFQVYSVAVEPLYSWYGLVNGTSVDYASTVYGIPFALELVMQLYDNTEVSEGQENFSDSALTQVWSRVIDVIFNFIWESTNGENELR